MGPTFKTVTMDLKEYVSRPEYRDIPRQLIHMRLAEMSKVIVSPNNPTNIDDALLTRIHDGILMYQMGGVETSDDYRIRQQRFDQEIWPKINARAKKNPGMTQLLLECGIWSETIAPFLVNVWECPAKAVLPAHGVAEDMLGNPVIISKRDPMFPFCNDQSYRMIQYRACVPQPDMRKAKKILFVGGGLVPELWTNGYPLGQLDQEVVIYDSDSRLPAYLEKILGGKLSDFGIEYRTTDFMEAFADESQWGQYDYAVCNGVMAYHTAPEEMKIMTQGLWRLLCDGGKVCFDLQLKHYVLLFDVLVLEWPSTMDTLDGYQVAVDLVTPFLKDAGFTNLKCTTEPYDADLGEMPAGMITVAQKATQT